MTVQEMIRKIPTLSIEERKQLMHALVESFEHAPKTHNALDFAGFAAELYDGTDAQEHVNQLRSEWDERS
jgi:hypothetical protein